MENGHHQHGQAASMRAHAPVAPHEHAGMIAEYRRRFWVSLLLTVPILLLSHGFWELFGFSAPVRFPGEDLVLFALSSAVYFYGGWPFLRGIFEELGRRQPGMMTLIAVAITAAYVYSSAVVFGLPGMGFYWELA